MTGIPLVAYPVEAGRHAGVVMEQAQAVEASVPVGGSGVEQVGLAVVVHVRRNEPSVTELHSRARLRPPDVVVRLQVAVGIRCVDVGVKTIVRAPNDGHVALARAASPVTRDELYAIECNIARSPHRLDPVQRATTVV